MKDDVGMFSLLTFSVYSSLECNRRVVLESDGWMDGWMDG
jgi:hypothetical protein